MAAPLAAGLAVIMVPAALTYLRRREPSMAAVNAVLFVLGAFVAAERFEPYSF